MSASKIFETKMGLPIEIDQKRLARKLRGTRRLRKKRSCIVCIFSGLLELFIQFIGVLLYETLFLRVDGPVDDVAQDVGAGDEGAGPVVNAGI